MSGWVVRAASQQLPRSGASGGGGDGDGEAREPALLVPVAGVAGRSAEGAWLWSSRSTEHRNDRMG